MNNLVRKSAICLVIFGLAIAMLSHSVNYVYATQSKSLKRPITVKAQQKVIPKNLAKQGVAIKKEVPPPMQEFYKVTRVVDGDTFDVSVNGRSVRIRGIGLDTPEVVDPRKPVQCFGKEASRKAVELLLNKKVRLEADPTQGERDKYNRLLRYAFRYDGLFFNKWMIENGYAHEYTYGIPYKFQSDFKTAQQAAREGQMGLWAPDICAMPSSKKQTQTVPTTDTVIDNPQSEIQNISEKKDGHTWYTSSHSTARFYYCDTDLQWQGLSKKYLKSFSSEAELLSRYPRTPHEPCS